MEKVLKRTIEEGDFHDRKKALESLPLRLSPIHKGKGYSQLNDRYLLHESWRLGYGEWDKLKESIRKEPLFRFDYFLKSRSPAELGRRLDTLLTIRKREQADKKKKEKKNQEGKATNRKRKNEDEKEKPNGNEAQKKQKTETQNGNKKQKDGDSSNTKDDEETEQPKKKLKKGKAKTTGE